MSEYESERLALELQLSDIDASLQLLQDEIDTFENSMSRRLRSNRKRAPERISKQVTALQSSREELQRHLDFINKTRRPQHYNNLIDLTQEQTFPAERDGDVAFLGSVRKNHSITKRKNRPEFIDLTKDVEDWLIYGKFQSGPPTPSQNKQTSSKNNPQDVKRVCTACLEEFHIEETFPGKCEHRYCRDCLRNMFLVSMQDEQLYPPKCCKKPIKPKNMIEILSVQELQAYEEKVIEYSAPDRLYCAYPTCSKFIPKSRIKQEHGRCLSCKRQTHKLCRGLAHPGIDCPNDKELQRVLKIAKSKQWRRCPNCHTMIDRVSGCAHIYCTYAYISYLLSYEVSVANLV